MKKTNSIKLSIYLDKRIIIENYEALISISENEICVDMYMIGGSFLKISRMDNYMIEILGTIDKIVVRR